MGMWNESDINSPNEGELIVTHPWCKEALLNSLLHQAAVRERTVREGQRGVPSAKV
jgi:hypothetical protein